MITADGQDAAIAFLSDPASYGSEGPVERIDTHAAIVFLTADRAYKIKRAVRLPYLDFSTLEKRREVLEEELRLNRRTAPQLYLDVSAVRRRDDGTLNFIEGEPLEWVLVMRRFPSGALLEDVAGRGELNRRMVMDLADTIAQFHEQAERIECTDGAARARKVLQGNRDAMSALPKGRLPEADCERLHTASLAMLERIAPLLDERAASGKIRHCHGDLHLGNICLWEGRPLLFDALEFDTELATTDTLYDLAFLLMDLCERRLLAEANLLLNRYCDMTGQTKGLAALPLFLAMRATIRAHVSVSVAEQQADESGRGKKLEEARTYLATALELLDPPPARLVAIGGLSGTGKSTLAGSLAPDIGRPPGARWLRTDVLRKRLAGVHPEEKLPESAYTPERGQEVYRELARQAEVVLASGQSVIVDAVFASAAERESFEAIAQGAGVSFTGIWLEAPAETLSRRVDTRIGDASDADSAVVARQLEYDLGDLGDWHRVDASGTPEDVVKRARGIL